MCGGRGTRLGGENGTDADLPEKPLIEVHGTAMIDRVLAALLGSRVETIHPVVSPHTPATRSHLTILSDGDVRGDALGRPDADADRTDASPVEILDAPGEGYVPDLGYALDRISPPVLTVACDLALLSSTLIDRALDRAEGTRASLAVYVPAALKRQLGVSTDTTWTQGGRELAPTGLNVVASDEGTTTKTNHGNRSMEATDAESDTETGATNEATWVSYDARLAVNVNRPSDLVVAEALCE
ncbi:cobalamin biosynthesis protein CobY [Halobacteriales archaeon QH_8_64_26]|nr:MAG: cobalamin biosynthesis protein CobY [Halobacteriales archaeon QH_8_64_26]